MRRRHDYVSDDDDGKIVVMISLHEQLWPQHHRRCNDNHSERSKRISKCGACQLPVTVFDTSQQL